MPDLFVAVSFNRHAGTPPAPSPDVAFPVQLAALAELALAFAEVQSAWLQASVPGMPGVASQHQQRPLGSHRTAPLHQCLLCGSWFIYHSEIGIKDRF